jgi:hypothetical protein
MADPQFPWEMYLEAAKQKAKNKMDMMNTFGQTLAGVGQNVGQGLQKRGQMQAGNQLQTMLNPSPVQGPPTEAGVSPQQPPIDWGGVINQMQRAGMNPESLINQMAKSKMGGTGTKLPGEVWVNPQDPTDLSPVEKPGYTKYTTTQGDALNKLTGAAMGNKRNKAMEDRAQAWERSIDARQIDTLAKSVSLTPQQRNVLQQNNMRANRAIKIANQANTWQEFQAIVTDAGAVMQGGVPHVDQLHNMAYPSWKKDLAQIQTYATSQPTANVPQEFKDRVINMMQGIQQVDNRYLTSNADFMQKAISPTIRGGGKYLQKPIKDITGTITEQIPYTGGKKSGFDSDKEKRYQEWKAKNGY